jgi:hypothetical protein
MRAAFPIALVAFALSIDVVAHAQENAEPTPAQVRAAAEAFDKGREAYKAEDYVEAAEQFEKADSNAPSLAALELAIRARDKAGELDRAATLLALAQQRHSGEESLLKLADISRRASVALFELTATCDRPCDLTVGGKLVHGRAESRRTLYIQPGNLAVRAGWADDRSESRQVEAVAGARGEVAFVEPPSPAAKGIADEPEERSPVTTAPAQPDQDEGAQKSSGMSPVLFYVGAGLTAVLGGVTVWSGIDTLNNPGTDAVKKACDSGDKQLCDSLYEQGRSHQTRTNVLIGATAAVGVATIAIGIWGTDWGGGKGSTAQSGARMRPHVAVTAWGAPNGGGLQAIGRF